MIKSIGYDEFDTLLYTAPSGAVQVAFLWIGVFGCWLFPRNRILVSMALIIPPLVGSVLLMRLTVDAGWGMIAAAWLVSSRPISCSPHQLTSPGVLHHRRHVAAVVTDSFQLQRQHKAGNCQRHVLHWLLRWVHRFAAAMDREASLLQRRCDGCRDVVSSLCHVAGISLRLHA